VNLYSSFNVIYAAAGRWAQHRSSGAVVAV